jgi:hypothetical protein
MRIRIKKAFGEAEMKIRILRNLGRGLPPYQENDVIDAEDEESARLVALGAAEYIQEGVPGEPGIKGRVDPKTGELLDEPEPAEAKAYAKRHWENPTAGTVPGPDESQPGFHDLAAQPVEERRRGAHTTKEEREQRTKEQRERAEYEQKADDERQRREIEQAEKLRGQTPPRGEHEGKPGKGAKTER